jgi:hypothetical protein
MKEPHSPETTFSRTSAVKKMPRIAQVKVAQKMSTKVRKQEDLNFAMAKLAQMLTHLCLDNLPVPTSKDVAGGGEVSSKQRVFATLVN